jgi:molecular chaperone DnaK
MVYQFDQTIEQLGDKLDENDKSMLSEKKEAIKVALESDDMEQIKSAKSDFEQAFSSLAQKIYGQGGPGGPGGMNFDPSSAADFAQNFQGQQNQDSNSSDFVDVDYEVSDDEE